MTVVKFDYELGSQMDDVCGVCNDAPWGSPRKYDICTWIGHESIVTYVSDRPVRHENGTPLHAIVYFDTITQTELYRGVAVKDKPPHAKRWPGFEKLEARARRIQATHAALDKRLALGGDMAKMYGSVAGDRAAGHVCNRDEMTVQAETWNGLIRVVLKPTGEFEVYVADKNHENVIHLMNGNVDARTAVAAGDGKGVAAVSLADPLPRIHVKNRGAKYTHPGGGTPGGGKPSAAATSSAPQSTTTSKASTKQGSAGGAKAATSSTAPKSSGGSKKQTSGSKGSNVKLPATVEFKDLNVGDEVTLVTKDAKTKAEVGDSGKVEMVKLDGMLGPQIRVEFKKAGVASLFANNGDKVAKGAVKVPKATVEETTDVTAVILIGGGSWYAPGFIVGKTKKLTTFLYKTRECKEAHYKMKYDLHFTDPKEKGKLRLVNESAEVMEGSATYTYEVVS